MSDTRSYVPVTSFSQTPAVAQISSYIVLAFQVALFYAVVLPNLDQSTQITMGVLFSLTLLALLVSAGICSLSDPADPVMILYRNDRQKFQQFSSQSQIHLLYCDYCASYVKQKTRHCRVCDRCVQHFDHHCIWINNCVGQLNYKSFFLMIVAAFGNLTIFIIAISLVTVQSNFSDYLGEFIVGWISGAVNCIFAFLLFNLVALHIYLQCKGISTYQFIIAQREEEKRRKEAEDHQKMREKPRIMQEVQLQNHQGVQEQSDISLAERRRRKSELKREDSTPEKVESKLVRVRQRSISFHGESKEQEVIFGSKEVTNKADSQHQRQQSESSSIKVSQLFTRNKSLKLMIGNNDYYKPHHEHPSQKSKENLKVQSTT